MKPGFVLLGLMTGLCPGALAQEGVQRDTLVDRYFTSAPHDTAVIALATGRQYRAEVVGPTAELALTRPRAGSEAFLSPDPARTALGHVVLEVYARERGDHVSGSKLGRGFLDGERTDPGRWREALGVGRACVCSPCSECYVRLCCSHLVMIKRT